jgi:parallel beta-helix repeat protein
MVRKLLLSMFVASWLILSFSSLILGSVMAQVYIDVTVSQANAMIDTNPHLVILDVRNQSEYDTWHIRNAKLIPIWNLTQRLGELNKTAEILVYCREGVRSAKASQILVSNGFLNVYNMLEGINGWMAAGYPVYVRYSSIQAAIDNATDGETVYVSKGLYNERLSVSKSIKLVGENSSATIINGTATVLSVNADNVSLSDLTIRYTGCACYGYSALNVTHGQNINVTDNIIISDDFGIRVVGAREVTLAHNDIPHTGDTSIVVFDSSKVSVFENVMTASGGGVGIDNSTESIFWSNTILSSLAGIFVGESCGNTVFGNNVSSRSLTGLSISSCFNNSFFDNYVSSNSQYGLFIWNSYNNSVFHNCFLGNGSHVLNVNSTNSWDDGYPSAGNFWSNYAGVDSECGPNQNQPGSDGIGDTPHVIDSTNRDNYPLMGLFHTFNTSLNVDVDIVSNSTIDGFEYLRLNRTIMLQVSNMTADQTVGFCRISVPHSLIDPYNSSILVVIDNGHTPVLFLNNELYDNGTYRWIYFMYPHLTHEILIVPEFPVFPILSLFMITTVMTTATYKRRRLSKFSKSTSCITSVS